MSVLHTGTFVHVDNMQQHLISKQLTTCVCRVVACLQMFTNDARNIYSV